MTGGKKVGKAHKVINLKDLVRENMVDARFYFGALSKTIEHMVMDYDTDQDYSDIKVLKGLIALQWIADHVDWYLSNIKRTIKIIRKELGIGNAKPQEIEDMIERLRKIMDLLAEDRAIQKALEDSVFIYLGVDKNSQSSLE